MLLTEKALRSLIRRFLLENTDDSEDDILGEPDLSREKERDEPEVKPPDEDTIDELNVVGAAGAPAGNIRGVQAPMGSSNSADHLKDRPVTNGGPSDWLSGKKKKQNKSRKKS